MMSCVNTLFQLMFFVSLIAGYHRLGLQENYNAFLQGVGYWEPDLRCRDIKKKERK